MINAHQTKEEEIGSLPEKEFRIMIVKMIQNLENKRELQINSLETRIEKMHEWSSGFPYFLQLSLNLAIRSS